MSGGGLSSGYQAVFEAPCGRIGIRVREGRLASVDFLPTDTDLVAAGDAVTRAALDQLRHYMRDPHWRFSLPLATQGTAFQRRVWSVMLRIPVGSTRTYGAVAAELGSSARAVGGACRANPVPLVVPCHRVVAATGIGGFGGHVDGPELARKRWLLGHEGALLEQP